MPRTPNVLSGTWVKAQALCQMAPFGEIPTVALGYTTTERLFRGNILPLPSPLPLHRPNSRSSYASGRSRSVVLPISLRGRRCTQHAAMAGAIGSIGLRLNDDCALQVYAAIGEGCRLPV